ncbi:MAG: nuclear transport factor 2 family protein [Myxococcota bacterium]
MSEPTPGDGMTALERCIARDEIRQLACRYARAVDARDLELLVSLFVPDVRVGRDRSGHAALREFWRESLSSVGVSILFVGNHLIDFSDGDHATGSVYCRGQVQDGERWIEQAIHYGDTYERRDGAWLFVRRVHRLWYGVEAAERPLAQEPANWPERQEGRGTLPQEWPSWGAFWKNVGG